MLICSVYLCLESTEIVMLAAPAQNEFATSLKCKRSIHTLRYTNLSDFKISFITAILASYVIVINTLSVEINKF